MGGETTATITVDAGAQQILETAQSVDYSAFNTVYIGLVAVMLVPAITIAVSKKARGWLMGLIRKI